MAAERADIGPATLYRNPQLRDIVDEQECSSPFTAPRPVPEGTRSAGVQRQYTGTVGRRENCQLDWIAVEIDPFRLQGRIGARA